LILRVDSLKIQKGYAAKSIKNNQKQEKGYSNYEIDTGADVGKEPKEIED